MKRRRVAAREEIQRNIVDAALDVFASTPYDMASIRQIARSAGIAASTIYGYYPGKRELVLAVLYEKVNEMTEFLRQELQGIDSPEEKLRKYGWSFVNFLGRNEAFTRLVFFETPPIIIWQDTHLLQLMREQGQLITSIIAEGQQCGNFKLDISLRNFRHMFLGGLRRLIAQNLFYGNSMDDCESAHEISNLILEAIRKPDESRAFICPLLKEQTETERIRRD